MVLLNHDYGIYLYYTTKHYFYFYCKLNLTDVNFHLHDLLLLLFQTGEHANFMNIYFLTRLASHCSLFPADSRTHLKASELLIFYFLPNCGSHSLLSPHRSASHRISSGRIASSLLSLWSARILLIFFLLPEFFFAAALAYSVTLIGSASIDRTPRSCYRCIVPRPLSWLICWVWCAMTPSALYHTVSIEAYYSYMIPSLYTILSMFYLCDLLRLFFYLIKWLCSYEFID